MGVTVLFSPSGCSFDRLFMKVNLEGSFFFLLFFNLRGYKKDGVIALETKFQALVLSYENKYGKQS